MTGWQNLHTHTTFVDGKKTPEELIIAVLEKGGSSIGFSEHAHVPFDPGCSMTLETTHEYLREVRAMKEKYKGTIDIFLGLEQDLHTPWLPEGLDFIIATTHYVRGDGEFHTVDYSKENQKELSEKYYGGDFYAMAEEWFKLAAETIEKIDADIVGHFDLISKYNIDGCVFEERHPRYVKAALDSMDAILERCKLFEVNTGAMFRVGKTEPYPSAFLLKELSKRGAEVVLTSDSHCADSLFFKFSEMQELLKACGFKYMKRLTTDGFVDIKL